MKKAPLPEEIKMDGITYVPKESVKEKAEQFEGMDYVIVNGQVVISEGDHTGKLPGKILKKGVM